MMTLDELVTHRDIIDILKNRFNVNLSEAEALEVARNKVAAQMLSALITQLDSQSISFTP